jgi:hypothetical protein
MIIRKIFQLRYSIALIALGLVISLTDLDSAGPGVEGPFPAWLGVLCCLLGVWDLIRTLHKNRRAGGPAKPPAE